MTDGQTYDLLIAPGARRALSETLPPGAAFAAWEFISGSLVERPHAVGTRLRAPFSGHWSARRGEYRIRYVIDEDAHQIVVLDVDHRRDVYRTR